MTPRYLREHLKSADRVGSRTLSAAGRVGPKVLWPLAIIALVFAAWWFLPPIRSASSESQPPRPDPTVTERLVRIETDLSTVKDDVREIRGVLLKPR